MRLNWEFETNTVSKEGHRGNIWGGRRVEPEHRTPGNDRSGSAERSELIELREINETQLWLPLVTLWVFNFPSERFTSCFFMHLWCWALIADMSSPVRQYGCDSASVCFTDCAVCPVPGVFHRNLTENTDPRYVLLLLLKKMKHVPLKMMHPLPSKLHKIKNSKSSVPCP